MMRFAPDALTLSPIARHIARFWKDEKATVAVKAVVMVPMMFWGYVASFTFFDAYPQTSINVKAAYTISDMISRETQAINPAYMNGAHQLLELLTRSSEVSRLRVTIVRWDNVAKKYKLDWSKTKGAVTPLSATAFEAMSQKLPVMVHDERIIVVETWSKYEPPFKVGLNAQDLYNYMLVRPRFAPQTVWSDS